MDDEAPWAALPPVLDPTTMGWKQRDFYLDTADVPYLFDTNGNGGTTAWWNGRVVGCWVQDDARVRVVLRPGRADEIGMQGCPGPGGGAPHCLVGRGLDRECLQVAADEVGQPPPGALSTSTGAGGSVPGIRDCKSVKMRRAGYRLLVRNQPEQQAPPVQRLRVRYAKRGRLRFTSHRDFSRAFERAVFRARIPMAYSSGFNPHPRISYAGAAPTGSASEAEYLEIGLAQVLDPDDVHRMLDESLPEGLDVLEVVESPGGSLSDLLEGSRWEITLNGAGDLSELVATFLDTETVEVQRMTKKGLRVFDARAAVLAMGVQVEGDTTVLDVVLEHVVPAVRPDDVLSALAVVGEYPAEVVPLLTRVQQGTLDRAAAQVRDPLSVQP